MEWCGWRGRSTTRLDVEVVAVAGLDAEGRLLADGDHALGDLNGLGVLRARS